MPARRSMCPGARATAGDNHRCWALGLHAHARRRPCPRWSAPKCSTSCVRSASSTRHRRPCTPRCSTRISATYFSEAEFRTMKYGPKFPERFDGYDHARDFCREFFPWYNDEHRHSGLCILYPGRRPPPTRPGDPRPAPGGHGCRLRRAPGALRWWPSPSPRAPQSRLDQPTRKPRRDRARPTLNSQPWRLIFVDTYRGDQRNRADACPRRRSLTDSSWPSSRVMDMRA